MHSTWISIHALREESDPTWWTGDYIPKISIHALREESDKLFDLKTNIWNISIHALREESDLSYRAGNIY